MDLLNKSLVVVVVVVAVPLALALALAVVLALALAVALTGSIAIINSHLICFSLHRSLIFYLSFLVSCMFT